MSLALSAILFYDYLITFATEVNNIWRRPCNAVSLLFLANRYATIVGYISIIWLNLGSSPFNTSAVSLVYLILSSCTTQLSSMPLNRRQPLTAKSNVRLGKLTALIGANNLQRSRQRCLRSRRSSSQVSSSAVGA